MSAFDDLLDLGGPSDTTQGSDPFDPFASGQLTNQNAGNSGGDLLDLGFDAQISTENGNSGPVTFEANTNPLYEFTNSDSKMASDSSNPLYEFNNEPVQKEVKSEPSNLLYEFMQNEGTTNGHAEDGLTNGREQEVDLLGGGDIGGGDLMDGDSENVQNVEEQRGDLLGNSEPVVNDGFGVTAEESQTVEDQSGEAIQTRSRSSSENSEPEQENQEESSQKLPETLSESDQLSEAEIAKETNGPLEEGPKETGNENIATERHTDEVEGEDTAVVLNEGTTDVKGDVEAEQADRGEATADSQNEAIEEKDESKVEEQNIDSEEKQQESVEEKAVISNTDEAEKVEPTVESGRVEEIEPETCVVIEQNTPAEVEPNKEESSTTVQEVNVDGTTETEKVKEAEETAPAIAVEVEAVNEPEELKPVEKVEEGISEELEKEKHEEAVIEKVEQEEPAPEPEQTSVVAAEIEEPKGDDEKEAKLDDQVEQVEPVQVENTEKKTETLDIGVGLNVLHECTQTQIQTCMHGSLYFSVLSECFV